MWIRKKFILLDINTIQRYFKISGNKPSIRNYKPMIRNIRRVFAWIRSKKFPVISIIPDEECENFKYSSMKDKKIFPADNSTDLPIPRFSHDQIIFHSRVEDPFEEPKIERMLEELKYRKIVVMGISKSIIPTVLGLLQRGKRVIILEDAIRFPEFSSREVELAKRTMESKGAEITTTKEFTGRERRPLSWQKKEPQQKVEQEQSQIRTAMCV